MPQAIVATVPEPHAQHVADLWEGLNRRFAVRSELTEEFPHFSLHIAERYELDTVRERLQAFTSEQPPLRVRTAGLGMFTRGQHILYLPLVRNPRLNDFHRGLWKAVSGLGDDVAAYYRPERWIPHITLALDKVDQYNLGGAIHWLSDQKLDWVFDVTELAVLQSTEDGQSEVGRFPLEGSTDES